MNNYFGKFEKGQFTVCMYVKPVCAKLYVHMADRIYSYDFVHAWCLKLSLKYIMRIRKKKHTMINASLMNHKTQGCEQLELRDSVT